MSALVEVAVVGAAPGLYTYFVPPHLAARVQVGARVLVKFGGKKQTGVVIRGVASAPPDVVPVAISEVLDANEPALTPDLVELAMWIADYYEAPPGEAIRAALPAGTSISARAVYALTDAGLATASGEGGALPAKQRVLVAKLAHEDLAVSDATPATKRIVEELTTLGLVETRDLKSAGARLKRERVVRLVGDIVQHHAGAHRAPRRRLVIEGLARAFGVSLDDLDSGHRSGQAASDAATASDTAAASTPASGSDAASASDAATASASDSDAATVTASASDGDAGTASDSTTATASASESDAATASDAASASDAAATSDSVTASDAASASDAATASDTAAASTPASASDTDAARTASDPDSTTTTETDAASEDAETDDGLDEDAEPRELIPLAELERRIAYSAPVLRELAKMGLVEITDREAELEAVAIGDAMHTGPPPTLTDEQALAVSTISAAERAGTFKPFLLFGVTGSGKTEVYLRVIAETLEAGKTALVLVPEISLTPQLAARFRARFGDQVAILHSGLGEQARLGEWSRLRRGDAKIAVGARSAVFAPLARLGVIVVDEEHDGSFKQDEGVKYHARDVALVRAQRAGAVCVLGSGTPSLESNAQAEKGAYGKLVLTQRPMARPMPSVEILDLRMWQPDAEAFLSAPLRTAIAETLEKGDQIILFLNRRGFSTFVLCAACGHAFRCPNCSVSLTYHRSLDRMTCHYCSHGDRVPEACPKCQTAAIERKGLGTEKIAVAVAEAFPKARVARLDRDVASGSRVEAVLSRVARREVDILVGTQMVTKGHDFPGVTLVGVLCADVGLNLPDFRASERTFQLLAQVAGRAGRGDRPGRVLIQTYRPGAPAVTAAAAHDYEKFYAAEVEERRERSYPPHGRLIVVRVDGPDEHQVADVAGRAAQLCERAREHIGAVDTLEILGPTAAPLSRLRGRSRWQIWLRGPDRAALRKVARQAITVERESKVRVTLDVDPNSAL
jgi:primosomal protein N' (replication factor Y)